MKIKMLTTVLLSALFCLSLFGCAADREDFEEGGFEYEADEYESDFGDNFGMDDDEDDDRDDD